MKWNPVNKKLGKNANVQISLNQCEKHNSKKGQTPNKTRPSRQPQIGVCVCVCVYVPARVRIWLIRFAQVSPALCCPKPQAAISTDTPLI